MSIVSYVISSVLVNLDMRACCHGHDQILKHAGRQLEILDDVVGMIDN